MRDAIRRRAAGRTKRHSSHSHQEDNVPPASSTVGRERWPVRLVFADGTLEGLKWLGLFSMTLDHINKYLLNGSVPALFAVGRIALPLFAFVLAYNLARPSVLANAEVVFPRTLKRLVGSALLASIPFMMLGGLAGGWWPFNIMGTFFVAVAAIYAVRLGRWGKATAIGLVAIGGGVVEYWWPAVGMCMAAWCYCRRPSWSALTAWLLASLALNLNGWAFGGLPLVNASLWAIAASPVILAASRTNLSVPRQQWVFYAFYPAHLGALWLFRSL